MNVSDSGLSMRLFYCAALPEETIEKLSDLMVRLKKGAEFADARPVWVNPENLHITLLYLGEVSVEKVSDAKAAMRELDLQKLQFPIELDFQKLEVFPSIKNPMVISASFKDRNNQLTSCHKALASECERLGLDFDKKPYSPHLTLARTKSLKTAQRLLKLLESHEKYIKFRAEIRGINLMNSNLTADGPIYGKVESLELNTL